jgi:hypothetical protein
MKYLPWLLGFMFPLCIAAQCPTGTPPGFSSGNSVTFTEGIAATFSIVTTGSPVPTVSESGTLPPGVSFTATGLSGTPASGSAGTYPLTLTATNIVGPNSVQTFTLKVVPPVVAGPYWNPPLVTSWQWQLSTSPTASQLLPVQMYDVDGFDASTALINAMHAQGTKAVCYLSAGTYEDWRPDAARFPADTLGGTNGWPGEKWLDISKVDELRPIMQGRVSMCQSKGFDAVEFDNVDGYTNQTGTKTKLTAAMQITYNSMLADLAHNAGISAGLKNDVDQVPQLSSVFDFAINEQCFQYSECGNYSTYFIAHGKAVFEVEYRLNTNQFCPQANAANFNALLKDVNLTAKRTACR